jgi:hypothetical protein
MSAQINDNLILITGKSASGKSASLMGLKNPEGVWYANCEAGKKLPFKAKFKQFTIVDPLQVYEMFDVAETKPDIHTLVIDTSTYLMDMYESVYVIGATNTQSAWGSYSQYFKNLMQQYVARSTKNVIILAHSADEVNKEEMTIETKVPVKGSLKNNGIESFFSQVISAKKITIKVLKEYANPLLTITPEDEALGYKHVFQTRLTKDTVGERLRGPMGLFDVKETYINNDAQMVLDRLHAYYD